MLSHDGLILWSTLNMAAKTLAKSDEYFLSIGGYYPLSTLLKRPFISLALKGGFNVHISYKTQPSDQMSLLLP